MFLKDYNIASDFGVRLRKVCWGRFVAGVLLLSSLFVVSPAIPFESTIDIPILQQVLPQVEPASATATCALGGPCVAGNTGPGGGIVFYVASTTFSSSGSACTPSCQYLEAAPVSWGNGITVQAAEVTGTLTGDPELFWCQQESTTNATGTAIGTGLANTTLMNGCTSGAGFHSRAYLGGGLSDWYLPSQAEVLEMFRYNFRQTPPVSLSMGGSDDRGNYWASTETGSQLAVRTDLNPACGDGGCQHGQWKVTRKHGVRPVRAFAGAADTTAPTVSSFSSTTADGSYKAGQAINITATVNEAIRSGNTVTVTLETGATDRTVLLTAASAGTSLTGTYTVQAGDTTSDLTVSSFTIGTVLDTAGNAMTSITVPTGANNIAGAKALVIDTTAPTATIGVPNLDAASDSGVSSIDDLTNDSTPTFSVSVTELEVGATGTVKATKTGSPDVMCNLTAGSCTLGTLADGVWSVVTYQTDAAGNAGSSSSALSITIDTAALATVTLAASASTSTSATITFTVTGSEQLDCTTLSTTSGTDFALTSSLSALLSITQTSNTVCTVTATSAATAGGGAVTSTLSAAGSFSVSDQVGNANTTLTGSPQTITVTVPSPATTTVVPTESELVSAWAQFIAECNRTNNNHPDCPGRSSPSTSTSSTAANTTTTTTTTTTTATTTTATTTTTTIVPATTTTSETLTTAPTNTPTRTLFVAISVPQLTTLPSVAKTPPKSKTTTGSEPIKKTVEQTEKVAITVGQAPKTVVITETIDAPSVISNVQADLKRAGDNVSALMIQNRVVAEAPRISKNVEQMSTRLAVVLRNPNSSKAEIVAAKAAVVEATSELITVALSALKGNKVLISLPVTESGKLQHALSFPFVMFGKNMKMLQAKVSNQSILSLTSAEQTSSISAGVIDKFGVPTKIGAYKTLSAEPENRLVLNGGGFEPGTELVIWMYIDGARNIGEVLTNKNGKFAAQIFIPSEVVPGRYTLQINAKQGSKQIQSFHLGLEISTSVS